MRKPATRIAVVFLLLVAAVHLGRFILQVEVVVDEIVMPQWISIFGFLVPAGLALLLKRESGNQNGSA